MLTPALATAGQRTTYYTADAKGGLVLRFRMLRRFELEDGQVAPILGVFDLGKDGWAGRSIHVRNDVGGNFMDGTRVLWTRK